MMAMANFAMRLKNIQLAARIKNSTIGQKLGRYAWIALAQAMGVVIDVSSVLAISNGVEMPAVVVTLVAP